MKRVKLGLCAKHPYYQGKRKPRTKMKCGCREAWKRLQYERGIAMLQDIY